MYAHVNIYVHKPFCWHLFRQHLYAKIIYSYKFHRNQPKRRVIWAEQQQKQKQQQLQSTTQALTRLFNNEIYENPVTHPSHAHITSLQNWLYKHTIAHTYVCMWIRTYLYTFVYTYVFISIAVAGLNLCRFCHLCENVHRQRKWQLSSGVCHCHCHCHERNVAKSPSAFKLDCWFLPPLAVIM